MDKHKPDATYCLWDLVGYNFRPNEVINAIRKRQIPTIAGNYDFGIGSSSDDCGCAYKTDDEKANGAVSISQHIRKMKDAGIISMRGDGQTLYYSLVKENTNVLNKAFSTIGNNRKVA